MSKEFEVRRPVEGAETLISQFSLTQLDKVLERARRTVGETPAPEEVERYLHETYPEMTEHQRRKLVLLVCRHEAHDDFVDDDLASVLEPNDRTVELELRADKECYAGDIVFFRGERWILASRKDNQLVLKRW